MSSGLGLAPTISKAPRASSGVGDILLIGSSGQVGGALLAELGPRATATGRHPANPFCLDLGQLGANPGQALELIGRAQPEVIVVCAGIINVDLCEAEPARTAIVNAEAPGVLARAARLHGARTVLISTEYVFSGENGPYDEGSPPMPVQAYGRAKARAEREVLSADPDALIVRTTLVYGPEQKGANIAYNLARRLSRGQAMAIASDQVSNPIYNRDLARAIVALVDRRATGTAHVAGPHRTGRAEFARCLATAMSLPAGLVQPVPVTDLAQTTRRPLNAGLTSCRPELVDFRPMGPGQAVQDWLARPTGAPLPLEPLPVRPLPVGPVPLEPLPAGLGGSPTEAR